MSGGYHRNATSAAGTASFYDAQWARRGVELHYTDLNRVRFVVDSIRELVHAGGLRILDLGCGRGWMAPHLSPLGTVTGVDFSSTGIEFARAHYAAHGTFLLADPASPRLGLPADARFDVVVCSEVIEHAPDHAELVEQIRGFLRPGGWCVLTTPNGNVWPEFNRVPVFRAELQPVEHWLSTAELRALLAAHGFRVRRHEGAPVYGFRVGLSGTLQRRRVAALFDTAGLRRAYARLILPTAVYQFAAAELSA